MELELLGSRPALAVPPVGVKMAALAIAAVAPEAIAVLFDFCGLGAVVVAGTDDGDGEPEDEEAEGDSVEVVMHVLQRGVEKDASCVFQRPRTLTPTTFWKPMVSSTPLGH